MAEITLREYIREIGILIDNEHLDEAIAHCQHILQVYPKHLETYRQLGKAYLEANRFTDAADVFQRVLSAVPGDFVSHVGMAVIREDEGNLDAAIWHMERAYESNPANTAIHEELRRLISERDGTAPQKIRLTRGALAHMYARGEMYQQAIVELQTSLEEEPDRPDLQVLLAEMYWRTGQRVEAAEVCSEILEELPFCQEANRIMAAMLQTTDQAEEGTVYHRRLAALDPYAAFIESAVIDPDTVTDEAVRLDRGEWRPGEPIPSMEGRLPDWAAEIGLEVRAEPTEAAETEPEAVPEPAWLEEIGMTSREPDHPEEIEEPAGEEPTAELPAWLEEIEPLDEAQTVIDQELTPTTPPFADQGEPEPAEGEAGIPEWMQEAGWEQSTGELEDATVSFSDEELAALEAGASPDQGEEPGDEEEELAPAEIPDWLMEIAPAESEAPEEELLEAEEDQVFAEVLGGEEEGEEEPPDWLSGIIPEAQSEGAEPAVEYPTWAEEPAGEAEIEAEAPDWMRGISQGPEEPVEAAPEWLSGVAAEPAEEAPGEITPEEAPEWLSGLSAQAADKALEEAAAETPGEEVVKAGGDWLPGVTPEAEEPAEELEERPLAEERELEPEADLGWLNALAPEAEPEEAEAEFYQPSEEPAPAAEAGVDWLSGLAGTGEEMPEGGAPLEAEEVTAEPQEEFEPAAEVEGGWLSGLADAAEEAAEDAARAEGEGMAAEAEEEPVEPGPGLVPSWLEAEEPGESSTVVGWLGTQSREGRGEGAGGVPEETEAEAPPFYSQEERPTELPAWLSSESEAAEPPAAPGELSMESAPEAEEALRAGGMPAEEREQEAQARDEQLMDELEATEHAPELAREAETPDWLKDYAEEISEPSEEEFEREGAGARAEIPLPPAEEPAQAMEPDELEREALGTESQGAPVGAEIPAEETVEWMDRGPSEASPEEELAFEAEAEELEEELYETPDWLQEIAEEPGIPMGAEEVGGVSGFEDEFEAKPGEFEWEEPAGREEPEWLREAGRTEEAEEILDEVEIPDWLMEPAEELDFEEVEEEVIQPGSEGAAEEFEAEEPIEAAAGFQAPEGPEPPVEGAPVTEAEYPAAGAPEVGEEEAWESGVWAEEKAEPEPDMAGAPRMQAPGETAGPPPLELDETLRVPGVEVSGRKPFAPDDVLERAKQALDEGDFEAAAGDYGELTRQKEALPTTIEDLRGTLEKEPHVPQLWLVLGDAYMQMDRIAEAIEAYQRGTEVV